MMEDLSLHILDIVENSVAAGASHVAITINENRNRDVLTIRVSDDGRGMSKSVQKLAFDPFFTTKTKKTGLGLPFLAQAAEQSGGWIILESAPGHGTKVTAGFRYGHIDRPPLTKMAETVMMLIFGHPEIGFRYRHRRNGRDFTFDSLRYVAQGSGRPVRQGDLTAVRKVLEAGLKRIGAS